MILTLIKAAAVASSLHCGFVAPDRVLVNFPVEMNKQLKYVAIVDKDRWYTIVDEKHRFLDYQPGLRSLTFQPSQVQGVDYRDGKAVVVRMFQHPGLYKLVFTDNLDTDVSEMASITCPIRVK